MSKYYPYDYQKEHPKGKLRFCHEWIGKLYDLESNIVKRDNMGFIRALRLSSLTS